MSQPCCCCVCDKTWKKCSIFRHIVGFVGNGGLFWVEEKLVNVLTSLSLT